MRPTRAGRARAAAGVASQPNTFYAGFDNGGVWRSTDYGANWVPLFDDQSTGSIGAIAVATSNPSVIYMGTGAGIIRPDLAIGDGMYKSTDAGRTWQHLGLRDSQMIAAIAVDPGTESRTFVFDQQPREIRFALAVAGTKETVTVTAEAPPAAPSAPMPSADAKTTVPSQNVINLQRRAAGVLPIRVDVPRAGTAQQFVKPLVVDQEAFVVFRYKQR